MNTESAADRPGAEKAGEAAWRRYPHLEAAIESESPAVLAEIEGTRVELERLSRSGATWERQRARTALAAYDRALDVYRELTRLRGQMLPAASNMGSKAAINE